MKSSKALGFVGYLAFAQPAFAGADKAANDSASALGGVVLVLMAVGALVSFYFLPTIVAFIRKKNNKMSILVLNLFLGWSIIGWVIALVWATAKDQPEVQHIIVQQQVHSGE